MNSLLFSIFALDYVIGKLCHSRARGFFSTPSKNNIANYKLQLVTKCFSPIARRAQLLLSFAVCGIFARRSIRTISPHRAKPRRGGREDQQAQSAHMAAVRRGGREALRNWVTFVLGKKANCKSLAYCAVSF